MLRLKRLLCGIMVVTNIGYLGSAQGDPARDQSRSMVMTQYGITATSQQLRPTRRWV
jgi:hypothetical protein